MTVFLIPQWRCAVLKGLREGVVSHNSGGYGEGETPLSIPNRAVKPLSADGTWPARARESRTPPVICQNEPPPGGSFAFRRGRPPRGARGSRARDYPSRVDTERLQLRPLADGDVEALVELDGFAEIQAAVDPFAEHIPADLVARSEYERRLVGRAGFYGAVDRASGRLVGWFQLEDAHGHGSELELGYRLRPDVWGRGFATEGARALVASALTRDGLLRVYAHALVANPGSIRVMEKVGLTYTGPWEYRGLPGAEYEVRPPAA